MPCYDPDSSPSAVREDARHNSDVAEMLCALCKSIEADGWDAVQDMSPELRKWWEEHKSRDAAKAKQEQYAKPMTAAEVARSATNRFSKLVRK